MFNLTAKEGFFEVVWKELESQSMLKVTGI